jgi:diacylglycerol O-acyltransferase / wax synthase
MYVIEGLAGGDVGLLTKMHHAAIDGMAGIELAGVLLDTSPDPAPRDRRPDLVPELPPSTPLMLARGARGVLRVPTRTARWALHTARQLPTMGGLARMALPGGSRSRDPDGGLLSGPTLQAPATPFNAPVTPHRRVAWTILDLERIKAVKRVRGTTVNDVVMAITAGAVRRHLREVDALPDRPLQAMVPISVRSDGDSHGNRVTAMVGLVPTHIADPLGRLDWVAGQMRSAKEHDAVPADVLSDVSSMAPPLVAARAARVVTRLQWANRVRLPFNMVISNIPGPPVPLYVAGARLKHMIPVSAIHDGLGFNVTIISHESDVDVGLVADREVIDDLWHVAGLFEASAKELYDACGV